jgi:hypothetical protein
VEQALARLNHGVPYRAADDMVERWANLAEFVEAGRYDALVPSLRAEWAAYGELAARVALREGGPPAGFLPARRHRQVLWVFLHSRDEEVRPATLRLIDLMRLAVGGQAAK